MIARHRGEHHQRGIWQPRRDRPSQKPAPGANNNTQAARHAAATTVLELASGAAGDLAARRSRARRPRSAKALALLLAGLAGFAAHQLLAGKPISRNLPATPRKWVSAYEAAAIDNPRFVCNKLFAPQLAAAYTAATHHSCSAHFERVKATSVRVRQVLKDGATAIVELHQTIERTDWNVVLARHDTGWRAVDLIPGRPLL